MRCARAIDRPCTEVANAPLETGDALTSDHVVLSPGPLPTTNHQLDQQPTNQQSSKLTRRATELPLPPAVVPVQSLTPCPRARSCARPQQRKVIVSRPRSACAPTTTTLSTTRDRSCIDRTLHGRRRRRARRLPSRLVLFLLDPSCVS
ncbi:hypothetical protein AMAG_18602 [Allomyces macrogynus ATCC 38327]|uniref:Uncharacterized protein n=1 Tax=Allomyces macrogynus (strain ATCC 38327) TaxID=578462 RepID=A0A0L0SE87_ALLM3|nr:hypothetical protein AMAG_18602 [Allomyces macrogynus ATCC 38327]|eukprot:KNE60752.1 hypothetical protein AMAG_18602 [Allomyces macrogynus ATCC 38327]